MLPGGLVALARSDQGDELRVYDASTGARRQTMTLPARPEASEGLTFTADYQLIVNPAYNADRGPVSVFSGRLHGEFWARLRDIASAITPAIVTTAAIAK